jgi:hypothetical protein
VERAWNTDVPEAGLTVVGATLKEDKFCNGVIVKVSPEELLKFDEREDVYHRQKLPISSFSFSGKNTLLEGNVWIYLTDEPKIPSSHDPIVQSYVDVILTGCLDFGESFAKEFIEQTQGWSYPWLDDRESPRYIRALKENSRKEKIDAILKQTIPEEFKERI